MPPLFNIGINVSGVWVTVESQHQNVPLSSVSEYVRTRMELNVSTIVHLGYERPVHSSHEWEVVCLSPSLTVLQAYNKIIEVSKMPHAYRIFSRRSLTSHVLYGKVRVAEKHS